MPRRGMQPSMWELVHGTHSGCTYWVSPQPDHVEWGDPRSPQCLRPPCSGQLSPRTLSGSPRGTWLPSERSAEQSFSEGWGRTWGEKLGVRVRLSKCSSIQAVSAAGLGADLHPSNAGAVAGPQPCSDPRQPALPWTIASLSCATTVGLFLRHSKDQGWRRQYNPKDSYVTPSSVPSDAHPVLGWAP